MQIKWTEPAAKALESIQDYIAKDNPRVAFEVAQKLRHATKQLSDHPKLGRAGRVRGTYELGCSRSSVYRAVQGKGQRDSYPKRVSCGLEMACGV